MFRTFGVQINSSGAVFGQELSSSSSSNCT
uniref:Uncharacterized protein n=1 Tax=Arundo donax TaxID=35708 RepID=A0A0A9C9R5_ARUDO